MAGPSDEILKVLKLIYQFAVSKLGKVKLFTPPLESVNMFDKAEKPRKVLGSGNQEFQENLVVEVNHTC